MGIPLHVRIGFGMLPTINLYDQPPFEANEVDDVMVDRLLSPESMTLELPAAKQAPQSAFRISHVFAELPRVLVRHRRGSAPSSSFG
jgi:hypothetical protein